MSTDLQSSASIQELDRLHIRWILAVNRFSKNQLTMHEIALLLKHNRIKWSELSNELQRNLESTKELGSYISEIRSSSSDKNNSMKNNKYFVKSVYYIVGTLLEKMDKLREKYYSENAWMSYTEPEKKFARAQIFKKEFNVTPKEFGFTLYKSLMN